MMKKNKHRTIPSAPLVTLCTSHSVPITKDWIILNFCLVLFGKFREFGFELFHRIEGVLQRNGLHFVRLFLGLFPRRTRSDHTDAASSMGHDDGRNCCC